MEGEPAMLSFSSALKNQLKPDIQILLDKFAEASDLFAKQSLKYEIKYERPKGDIRDIVNKYLNLLWANYITKFATFTQAIIRALNESDFLTYALVGRAMIEHTAVFRYYEKVKIIPLIDKSLPARKLTTEDLLQLTNILDQHLRGGRFNWQAYIDHDFRALFDRKRTPLKQIGVGECISEWEKDYPSITVLYDLFCDFVHPNLGSTLLVVRVWPEGTGIGGNRGRLAGIELFSPTFVGIASVIEEASRLLNNLLLLQFPIENLEENESLGLSIR